MTSPDPVVTQVNYKYQTIELGDRRTKRTNTSYNHLHFIEVQSQEKNEIEKEDKVQSKTKDLEEKTANENLKDPTVVKSEDKVQSKRNDLEDETKEIVKPNDQTVVEDEEEVQSKKKDLEDKTVSEKNLKDSTVIEYEDKLYKVQNKKKVLEDKTEEIDIASEKPKDPTVLVDEEEVQSKDVEDETEKNSSDSS